MIKYFLCPHKILRLRVCIFSAGSIEKEFTLIPLVGRDLTLSPCLSSEDVFITELWPRDVQSPHHLPLLLLWTDYPLFRVYWFSLQCWKASRMLPRAEDRTAWSGTASGTQGVKDSWVTLQLLLWLASHMVPFTAWKCLCSVHQGQAHSGCLPFLHPPTPCPFPEIAGLGHCHNMLFSI